MKPEIARLFLGRPWPWAADLWGVLGRGGGLSIRKGGAWGADEPSDESPGAKRYRAPSLGPAWSIRVIAAAVAAEQDAESGVSEENPLDEHASRDDVATG